MENILLEKYLLENTKFYSPLRHELCQRYAWAVPNEEAIKTIVKYSPIIEIGSGTGYWAKLISDAGAFIKSFDLFPPYSDNINVYHKSSGCYFPISEGNESKLLEYTNYTLMLCWPPYVDKMSFNVISNYSGKYLIYIGESYGGCTGCDEFHEYLYKYFNEVEIVNIPQWNGINDYLWIYERK